MKERRRPRLDLSECLWPLASPLPAHQQPISFFSAGVARLSYRWTYNLPNDFFTFRLSNATPFPFTINKTTLPFQFLQDSTNLFLRDETGMVDKIEFTTFSKRTLQVSKYTNDEEF